MTPGRVLVVDDSLYARHWIAAVLESEHFEVALANGLETAGTLLEQDERIDLVIARPNLPGTDDRYPAQLRAKFGLHHVPMIALIENGTSHHSPQQPRVLNAGFAGCVKRFNRSQLLESVRSLCRGRPEKARIPA